MARPEALPFIDASFDVKIREWVPACHGSGQSKLPIAAISCRNSNDGLLETTR
jgi:hypothetical protein